MPLPPENPPMVPFSTKALTCAQPALRLPTFPRMLTMISEDWGAAFAGTSSPGPPASARRDTEPSDSATPCRAALHSLGGGALSGGPGAFYSAQA